jgi:hypothetical protein
MRADQHQPSGRWRTSPTINAFGRGAQFLGEKKLLCRRQVIAAPPSRRTEATMSTTRSRGRSAVIPSACACRREILSALLISCRPDRHRPQSPRHPAPCLSSQFPDVLPKRASPMTDPAAVPHFRFQLERWRRWMTRITVRGMPTSGVIMSKPAGPVPATGLHPELLGSIIADAKNLIPAGGVRDGRCV